MLHMVQYVVYYVFRSELVSVCSQGFPGLLEKGAHLISLHKLYESFRIIDKLLRVPLGHSHPVLDALELNMPRPPPWHVAGAFAKAN